MALSHTLVFLALVVGSFAEVAEFKSCDDASAAQCTVTEVRMSPCKNSKKCAFKIGTNASISFDFTPKFAATKLTTRVTWPYAPGGEKAFVGLDNYDACELTTCPTTVDTPQTFNYNLYLGSKLPKGIYDIKWLLRNNDNMEENCCFLAKIQLKSKSKNK